MQKLAHIQPNFLQSSKKLALEKVVSINGTEEIGHIFK